MEQKLKNEEIKVIDNKVYYVVGKKIKVISIEDYAIVLKKERQQEALRTKRFTIVQDKTGDVLSCKFGDDRSVLELIRMATNDSKRLLKEMQKYVEEKEAFFK